MIVIKIAVNYIKRIMSNFIIVPLLILGPLSMLGLMNSGTSDISKKIADTVLEKYTQFIFLDQIKNLAMDRLIAASALAYFMMLAGVVLVGMNVSDRQNNTLMRIYTTPVRKRWIILGTFIGQYIISFIIAIAYMILANVIFKINWGSSYINIIVLTLFLVFASVSFGFFVSGLFKRSKAAIVITIFYCFISGFLSDGFTLSGQFNGPARFTINKWAYDAFAVIMQGNNLDSISKNLMVLGITGVTLFIAGCSFYGREKFYE
jgi:ABC-type multidrug transport system permease subunit